MAIPKTAKLGFNLIPDGYIGSGWTDLLNANFEFLDTLKLDPDCELGKMDHITEHTSGHGIVADVVLRATAGVKVDHIGENTTSHGVIFDSVLDVADSAKIGDVLISLMMVYG